MRKVVAIVFIILLTNNYVKAQLTQFTEPAYEIEEGGALLKSKAPTDTIMFNEFNNLPGPPTVLGYSYTNGTGYFFGTNYLDLDQDPTTPHEPGVQAIAQGYVVDSLKPYHIEAILLRVGFKQKASPHGTPLVVSLQYADAKSEYNINVGGTTVSYEVDAPGTGLAQVSVPLDSIVAGFGIWYTRVDLPSPVFVDKNYFVVLDLADFYLTNDKIGMYASAHGGASQIFGKENVLWLYPRPFLWLQVTHIYTTIDRCIAIFPIVDDGTSGIEDKPIINGLRAANAYPNPATDNITIDFETDHSSDVVVSLVDYNGRTISSVVLSGLNPGMHQHRFDVSNLPAGMYFYTLESAKGNIAKKFVKK